MVVLWLVVAVCAAVWISATDDLQPVAKWVSFLGAAVTFAGLLWAYINASSDIRAWWNKQKARLQRFRAWITRRPLPKPAGCSKPTTCCARRYPRPGRSTVETLSLRRT